MGSDFYQLYIQQRTGEIISKIYEELKETDIKKINTQQINTLATELNSEFSKEVIQIVAEHLQNYLRLLSHHENAN